MIHSSSIPLAHNSELSANARTSMLSVVSCLGLAMTVSSNQVPQQVSVHHTHICIVQASFSRKSDVCLGLNRSTRVMLQWSV